MTDGAWVDVHTLHRLSTEPNTVPAIFAAGPFSDVNDDGTPRPFHTTRRDHLLLISARSSTSTITAASSRSGDNVSHATPVELLTHGIHVIEFTATDHSGSGDARSRWIYVGKMDSTGAGVSTPSAPRLRSILVSFLQGLSAEGTAFPAESSTREIASCPRPIALESESGEVGVQVHVHVFARAQPEYLFPKSSQNAAKRVLSDRQLLRWWMATLNAVGSRPLRGTPNGSAAVSPAALTISRSACSWFVPGESEASLTSLRLSVDGTSDRPSEGTCKWSWGLAVEGSLSARETIPLFEDDAKKKGIAMLEPNDSVSQLMEVMAIAGECSTGKLVGLFHLTMKHSGTLSVEASSGVSQKEFNAVIDLLLSLNFADNCKTRESTQDVLLKLSTIGSGYVNSNIGREQLGSDSLLELETMKKSANAAPRSTSPVNNLQSLVKRKRPAQNGAGATNTRLKTE
ncbi:histone H3-K56 acetyltransferase [Zopfochytrium polystomum]|nr:histone H3-K56 acetyltransferase [Zopfochytrium polystomum]